MSNFHQNILEMRKTYTLITSVLILIATFSYAQQNFDILMQAGKVELTPNIDSYVASMEKIQAQELYNNKYYRVVQFNVLPTNQEKTILKNSGLELLNYLPSNAYVAAISKNFNNADLLNFNIRAVYPLTAELKLNHYLYHKNYPEWAVVGKDRIKLNIAIQKDITTLDEVEGLLSSLGYEVYDRYDYSNLMRLECNIANIDKLAALPFISFVETTDPPAEPENYTATTDHRTNNLASNYPGGRKYDGSGVLVALGDDGTLGPHIDFQGRLDQSPTPNNYGGNHGDHCGGIIAGAGNLDPKGRGNAFGVDMMVYDYPNNLYDAPNQYNTPGVKITSSSYSNGCNAGYTTFSQTLDQQTRQNASLIHVFSAGNSGTSNCSYGAGSGWGNITGGHKVGKNVIATGNLTYVDVIAGSSSRGPAHDGRIKPEICAVGTSVYSTQENYNYANLTGTSMACPGISGTLAQLYQAYKALNSGNNPDAGLMKALIMNTADDLGNPGPDYIHGYGRVNARRAVEVLEKNQYLSNTVTNTQNRTHNITVPAGTGKLFVMVYWSDYEASPGVSKALVNDIDMTVTAPTSTVYMPWVLNPTPNATALNSNATRKVDTLNNAEQVTIDNPAAGTYTITVKGTSIPQGPQKYYVIYEFMKDDVVLTYPIGGEHFVPGETETIRWDALSNTGNFTLQYSTNNGSSWNTITTSISGSNRYYNWTVPSTVTGQALMRISRGATADTSMANFSIIGVPTNLTLNWVCPDSMELQWNTVTGATAYEASMLGVKYMDSVGVSTGNTYVYKGINPSNEYWISVKALGPNGVEGRRAIAIRKAANFINCTISDDITLTAVTSPTPANLSDCQPIAPITVSINVQNTGQNNATNFPVKYRVNGGTVVSETYSGTLAPSASGTHTFAQQATISGNGAHVFEIWADLGNDQNRYNDTATVTVNITSSTPVVPPLSEDFESFTLCSTNFDCEATTCNMINGWVNDPNLVADDIDWRTNQGTTPSANTGPASDYNPGTAAGKYVYLEASNGCDNKTAHLVSPCVDLTTAQSANLTFRYHMNGADMGSLHIDVLDSGVWVNDIVTAISGNKGNSWLLGTASLTPYIGRKISVRFRGITAVGYRGDMALDDINISMLVGENNPGMTSLNVYPNPSENVFNVSLYSFNSQNATYRVMDNTGRIIMENNVSLNAGGNTQTINLNGFAKGIYHLQITTPSGRLNEKLLLK